MASTGIASLDNILGGVHGGDNIVFRVDDVDCYAPFVEALLDHTVDSEHALVYFRFGRHRPILESHDTVQTCVIDPDRGFEFFITQIHATIRTFGAGAYYVFDSLSDLSATRYSDRMIGTFFQLTCPYLLKLGAVAYFTFYRGQHSYHATLPIHHTTQVLIDVYRYEGDFYLEIAKCKAAPMPHTPFRWDESRLTPITDSGAIAGALSASPWTGLPSASYRMIGIWDRTFMRAEILLDAVESGEVPAWDAEETKADLIRLIIPREERMIRLAEKYLDLRDVLYVWKRMIGTGMIGGKSAGMLVARSVLARTKPELAARLEPHDSFFIGSDVYYTFLVTNDCWWDRERHTDPAYFDSGLDEIRERIRTGEFPPYILRRLSDLIEHFGSSPIIVRSSSLLEDAFGNAFSGKYESVFCANQGTHEQRLHALIDAVRTVYASTLSYEALSYRHRRGVLHQDEQMALLVQRVSGAVYDDVFLPQLAGVVYSFNPYAWSKSIQPQDGVMRLVFGLGTRAVDRHDDDYTRIVALGAPEKRPESSAREVKRYVQRRADVIDLQSNQVESVSFYDLVERCPSLPLDRLATRDRDGEREARRLGMARKARWLPTFEPVFRDTDLVDTLRRIAQAVRQGYESEVDMEVTANLRSDGSYTINILQCRPFQAGPDLRTVATEPGAGGQPESSGPEDRSVRIACTGGVIGRGRRITLDWVLFVTPEGYSQLSEQRRHAVARLIGTIVRHERLVGGTILLIGPGRWGSSSPSLGVPVAFSDISTVAAIMELDAMHAGLVPDLSLGTHFFNDLVEMDILYIAHFGRQEQNKFDYSYFTGQPSILSEVAPEAEGFEGVLRVIPSRLTLEAIATAQRCAVYE